LAPNPDLAREGQGLTITESGVGLKGLGDGTRNIVIDVGGPVQLALLYWAGRDRPCPVDAGGSCEIPSEPYLDQALRFDGSDIVGTIVGTENQSDTNNIGYRADVTDIVGAKGPGIHSFTIQDGDTSSNFWRFNGAGLLVVYTNEADSNFYRLTVFEGLDFAFGSQKPNPTPAVNVTEPINFTYDDAGTARLAELVIFAGDSELGRPDRIDISDNPSRVNELSGAEGPAWDTLTTVVNVPSGVGSTTVQLFSEPIEQNPDSLLWEVGALRVPLSVDEQLCRVTGGGWDESTGLWDGSLARGKSATNGNGNGNAMNRYTFGGQAGAPTASPPEPRGEWTHHQQSGPDGSFVFHAGTSSAPFGTEIARISCSDPDNCIPARTAPFKQIDFVGVGTFKNIKNPSPNLAGVDPGNTFHWFMVHIEDLGEPGKNGKQNSGQNCPPDGSAGALADCDCADFYRIKIFEGFTFGAEDPNKTDIIYEGFGYVEGGNLQIHPPIK